MSIVSVPSSDDTQRPASGAVQLITYRIINKYHFGRRGDSDEIPDCRPGRLRAIVAFHLIMRQHIDVNGF